MPLKYFNSCTNLDEVKKLYRQLAFKLHPDKGGSNEEMAKLNEEYQYILKNPFMLSIYKPSNNFNKNTFLTDLSIKEMFDIFGSLFYLFLDNRKK